MSTNMRENPGRNKSTGVCFCLSSLFTEIEQKNFYFITFSINIDRLFACRRILVMEVGEPPPLRHAVNLNLLIINNFLFLR